MIEQWKPDMIRLMRDAAEREPFYKEIAAEIAAKLPAGAHVCDAGCGLGYLALHLARRGFAVTAVDINRDALSVFRENCAAEGLRADAPCGDIACLPPEKPYDAMVFCFFGEIGQILRLALRQCRGDVFIIARNYHLHRFSPGEHRLRRGGLREMAGELDARGIPFCMKEMSLSFGQPLKSREDARLFFSLYGRDGAVTEEFIDSRIVKAQDGEFPYYMPHRREIGFLHFRTADIRGGYEKEDSREDGE